MVALLIEGHFKVVCNLKMLVVGRLRQTFSTCHNLFYNCLITKSLNAPNRVNIKALICRILFCYSKSVLAFFQEFFQGGKIYCYANFFRYANFSTVLGPNFRGANCLRGRPLLPPCGRKPAVLSRKCSTKRKFGMQTLQYIYSNMSKNGENRWFGCWAN